MKKMIIAVVITLISGVAVLAFARRASTAGTLPTDLKVDFKAHSGMQTHSQTDVSVAD